MLINVLIHKQTKADAYLGQLAEFTEIQVIQPANVGIENNALSHRLLRFEHKEALKPWECVVS